MQFRSYRNTNAAPRRPGRKHRVEVQSDEVIGRLTILDAEASRIEIDDERSGGSVWVDLSAARMRDMVDSDGDGQASITDLFPGDRLRVIGKRDGSGTMHARSLWHLGPHGEPGGLSRLAS